jgi:arsenite methyltransferase
VNQAVLLRRHILAVAAASQRHLDVSRHRVTLPPAVPASGAATPVLVIGAWEGDLAWSPSAEVILADGDRTRLESTALQMIGLGATSVRRVRADADDLKLDLDRLSRQWELRPPANCSDARRFFARAAADASRDAAIPDGCCAIVCCAMQPDQTEAQVRAIVAEAFRVLRRGGVARFTVRLADEPSADTLLSETAFSRALVEAGFYGVRILDRAEWPLSVERGIEIREHRIEAFRGKEGACLDCHQAVIYRGPWKKVFADDGHVFERDARTAVCEKTFRIMTAAPYAGDLIPVEPHVPVPLTQAQPFHCRSVTRSPSVTKGLEAEGASASSCC